MYSLDNLKLKQFIKVSQTGEFYIISKNSKKRDWLKDNWKKLEKDYLDLFGEEKISVTERLNRDIRFLECKLFLIRSCCNELRFSFNEDVVKILNENGFYIDKDNYLESIDTILKNSESINISIAKKTSKIPKKNKVKSKLESFDKTILTLCSIAGVMIRPNDITVTEYKSLLVMAEEKIKALNHGKSNS